MAAVNSPATVLLQRMARGDERAAHELLPLIYGELQGIARRVMGDRAGAQTLQPTALVHEAWLKLVDSESGAAFEGRSHFLGLAAKAMRSVLVDHARRRGAEKRGGTRERVPLDSVVDLFEEHSTDLVALDEALTRFSAVDPELARIVELRFFGGLSVVETATTLDVGEATVVRGWRVARMWLQRALSEPAE